MSTGERFDDAELALIAAAFDGGGHYLGGGPVSGYVVTCQDCGRRMAAGASEDEARRAPHCPGVARRRVAAKARRMQGGAGGGG